MTDFENLDLKKMENTIEALLFAAGSRVSIDKITEVIEVDKKTTKLLISNMMYSYNNASRGVMIREINGGYQLCSRPEYHESIKSYFEPKTKHGLSQAAFETLAIIAYNAPITKVKIEKIRGVNSDSAVGKLIEKSLVREAGRLDAPGKPVIYETTEEFLRNFGFTSKSDLPVLEMEEVKNISSTPKQ